VVLDCKRVVRIAITLMPIPISVSLGVRLMDRISFVLQGLPAVLASAFNQPTTIVTTINSTARIPNKYAAVLRVLMAVSLALVVLLRLPLLLLPLLLLLLRLVVINQVVTIMLVVLVDNPVAILDMVGRHLRVELAMTQLYRHVQIVQCITQITIKQ